MTIPTTSGEVTAGWLTEVLRTSGAIGGEVSVADAVVDSGRAGVGFMGEVASVRLTYAATGDCGTGSDDQAVGPAAVVVKFPTPSPEIRAMMHPTRIYEREHRFYRELSGETPLRTPLIHHVTCEPAADPMDEQYLLVMEDFSHLTLGDQVSGVSPDQAAAALVGLGTHHARFWHGNGLEQADFIPIINGPLNQAGGPIYTASLPGFLEAFGNEIKPELQAFVDGYAEERPRIIDDLADMPRTLVHFDYRADNIFFDDEGGIAVIDWQAISQGGGAADVGYFLSQNLGIDVRRAYEDDLLGVYHDALVAGGVTGYDLATLRRDYRIGIECGWIIPVLAVGSLDFSSDRAVALWTEVLARTQAALLDHELA